MPEIKKTSIHPVTQKLIEGENTPEGGPFTKFSRGLDVLIDALKKEDNPESDKSSALKDTKEDCAITAQEVPAPSGPPKPAPENLETIRFIENVRFTQISLGLPRRIGLFYNASDDQRSRLPVISVDQVRGFLIDDSYLKLYDNYGLRAYKYNPGKTHSYLGRTVTDDRPPVFDEPMERNAYGSIFGPMGICSSLEAICGPTSPYSSSTQKKAAELLDLAKKEIKPRLQMDGLIDGMAQLLNHQFPDKRSGKHLGDLIDRTKFIAQLREIEDQVDHLKENCEAIIFNREQAARDNGVLSKLMPKPHKELITLLDALKAVIHIQPKILVSNRDVYQDEVKLTAEEMGNALRVVNKFLKEESPTGLPNTFSWLKPYLSGQSEVEDEYIASNNTAMDKILLILHNKEFQEGLKNYIRHEPQTSISRR